MKVLLDTHALVWWVTEDRRLSARARQTLLAAEHELFLSSVSAWELAIKVRLGKLKLAGPVELIVPQLMMAGEVTELPVTLRHALHVGSLPLLHGDPFDHMLIAQAQLEDMTLLTHDRAMQRYDVKTIW